MESLIEKRERLIREQKEVERQMNLLEEQENREEAKRIFSKMKEKNLTVFVNKDKWLEQFDQVKHLRTQFTSQVLMLNEILPHGIEYDDYDSLIEALVEEVKNQAPISVPIEKLKPGEVYVQGVHSSVDGKVIIPADAKDLIFIFALIDKHQSEPLYHYFTYDIKERQKLDDKNCVIISCDELRKKNRVAYLF